VVAMKGFVSRPANQRYECRLGIHRVVPTECNNVRCRRSLCSLRPTKIGNHGYARLVCPPIRSGARNTFPVLPNYYHRETPNHRCNDRSAFQRLSRSRLCSRGVGRVVCLMRWRDIIRVALLGHRSRWHSLRIR